MRILKDEEVDEIVYTLTLFEGHLSLSEILNTERPFLEDLKAAKIKLKNKAISSQH